LLFFPRDSRISGGAEARIFARFGARRRVNSAVFPAEFWDLWLHAVARNEGCWKERFVDFPERTALFGMRKGRALGLFGSG